MAAKGSRRDPAKERFWREAIESQSRSGQSVRAFCRERELAESNFHFWRRELRQREAGARKRRHPESSRKAFGSDSPDGREMFLPVSVARTNRASSIAMPGATAIEMVLPSGAVLRWPGGDADAVAEWIATLEARLC